MSGFDMTHVVTTKVVTTLKTTKVVTTLKTTKVVTTCSATQRSGARSRRESLKTTKRRYSMFCNGKVLTKLA